MVKRITLSLTLAFVSISSASAQSSDTPALAKKIQDTQLYVSDISSIGIENSSGNVRHRIIGRATYSSGRCGTPGTKCVGIPAPQPTELLADESGSVVTMSSLGVFAACRRVIESANSIDTFVLRGDFEKLPHLPVDGIQSTQRLLIKKLTSCFHYRARPEKAAPGSATESPVSATE